MSIPGSASPLFFQTAAGAGGYEIERSLRFNSDDSAYLNRTPTSAGNRRTYTWSGWVKKHTVGTGSYYLLAADDSPNADILGFEADSLYWSNAYSGAVTSTDKFRDPSAWYHIVFAVDSTQATDSNRVKMYANGRQITSFSSTMWPSLNREFTINDTVEQKIGRYFTTDSSNFYLADIHFIDGQALAPTDFGEFDDNGVWQPIAYAGTYGTNGFHLDFSDNSSAAALGADSSGNGNDWTVNNISVTAGADNDSLFDSPTNGTQTDTGAGGEVSGNYCTMNPLVPNYQGTSAFSNGNLTVSDTAGSTWGTTVGTFPMTSGKWYWEVVRDSGTDDSMVGIKRSDSAPSLYYDISCVGYRGNGDGVYNGSFGNTYGNSYANGVVVGVAVDIDTKSITFYNAGSSQGAIDFSSIAGDSWVPVCGDDSSGTNSSWTFNFGQRAFAYSAPSGYKALCTTNLPDPTIADGSTAMDIKLYTGTEATLTISGYNFAPDLVWRKGRQAVSGSITESPNNLLFDTVRGAGKRLISNDTSQEDTGSTTLTAFTSDGFTLGSSTDGNDAPQTYVAWAWDAGTSTVSNTDGTITSSVRANPSAGFSIVSYTGTGVVDDTQTIGHGLNAAPAFVLCKRRDLAGDWWAGHVGAGWTKGAYLQVTDAFATGSKWWSNTAPTSSVVTLGQYPLTGAGSSYVAYCFAPVAGYSSFGSYTGNGSTDGPFVYTGFRPRWVMYKSIDTNKNWQIQDTERDSDNPVLQRLSADLSDAEYTGTSTSDTFDALSNGFKIRGSNNGINQSATTYIYAAFAENPFKTARAR